LIKAFIRILQIHKKAHFDPGWLEHYNPISLFECIIIKTEMSFFSCFACGGESNVTIVHSATRRLTPLPSPPTRWSQPTSSTKRTSNLSQQIIVGTVVLGQQIPLGYHRHLLYNRYRAFLHRRWVVLHQKENIANPQKGSTREVNLSLARKAM
jgi:hypothetical protein